METGRGTTTRLIGDFLTRSRRLPPRLPFRPHAGAIDLFASEVDLVDPSRVRDVVERVGVEDNEVGVLAGRNHARIQAYGNGGITGRGDDGLHRRDGVRR